MPEVWVKAVHGGRLLDEFIGLAYRLYRGDPLWVPPLRREERATLSKRHPFFEHADAALFLGYRDGAVAGRIAAILDRNAPPESGARVGSFGYFECVDHPPLAKALLESAAGWLREHGAGLMRGPVSPSINYTAGVLVEGFDDRPCFGTAYNPRYYDSLLRASGLAPVKDMLALRLRMDDLRTPKALRFARFARADAEVSFRGLDGTRLEREAELIHGMFNQAWSGNWGYAPPSSAEVRAIVRELWQFAVPEAVRICEVKGRPAGVLVALPDLNQALAKARGRLLPFGWWHVLRARKTATRARIFMVGVLPEWQSRGISAGFIQVAALAEARRISELEASWILEDNMRAVRGLQMLGAEVSKRYRLYQSVVG